MHVRTNRHGMTILTGDITQVQTLETRVTKALAEYGLSSKRGPLHARTCELVRTHPRLTAEQAAAYVVSKVTA